MASLDEYETGRNVRSSQYYPERPMKVGMWYSGGLKEVRRYLFYKVVYWWHPAQQSVKIRETRRIRANPVKVDS